MSENYYIGHRKEVHMSSFNPLRNVRQRCSLHFTDRAVRVRFFKGIITELEFQLRLTQINATFSILKVSHYERRYLERLKQKEINFSCGVSSHGLIYSTSWGKFGGFES